MRFRMKSPLWWWLFFDFPAALCFRFLMVRIFIFRPLVLWGPGGGFFLFFFTSSCQFLILAAQSCFWMVAYHFHTLLSSKTNSNMGRVCCLCPAFWSFYFIMCSFVSPFWETCTFRALETSVGSTTYHSDQSWSCRNQLPNSGNTNHRLHTLTASSWRNLDHRVETAHPWGCGD